MLYNTGLTEQEKESLIIYLCIKGRLVLKDGRHVFEFFGDLDMEDKFSAAPFLEKAFINIQNQVLGIEGDFE